MCIKKVLLLFLPVMLFLLYGCVSTDKEVRQNITDKNLAVTEINKMTDEIEADIRDGKIKTDSKQIEYAGPNLPTLKAVYLDSKEVARKYVQEKGSDDSNLIYSFYYDENKLLMYVRITGGAVNGSELKHDIYFDMSGNRIQETHQYTKGPGYTFPEIWPEEDLILKPKDEYNKNEE